MTDDELRELENYIEKYWKASDIGAISIQIAEARWLVAEVQRLRAAVRHVDMQPNEVFCSHTEGYFCVFCDASNLESTAGPKDIRHDNNCVWRELQP